MAKSESEVAIGKYLFDSLTLGMYANPLCVFREYIQNSADAIDKAISSKQLEKDKGEILITVDQLKKIIKIEDNGCGVRLTDVHDALLSVGNSQKSGLRERGFRGIGRLGGMAYCDEIEFETKGCGEDKISINVWDCQKIRHILDPHQHQYKDYSFEKLVKECAQVTTRDADQRALNRSFFKVTMKNVNCDKNILLDLKEVKRYISAVAPVPFDYRCFPFGKGLDEKFKKDLPTYNTFKILVNNVEMFKPYKTTLNIPNREDAIQDVVEFEILDDNGKVIAKGWRGEREKLNAQIPKTENVDGIRIRVGNIMLGDEERLDKVFKEERFNAWFIGEIHAVDPRLVPNSRRDDFEDNPSNNLREIFYDSVSNTIGILLSNQVRERSKVRSTQKQINNISEQILNIKNTAEKGFVGDAHKKDAIKRLSGSRNDLEELLTKTKKDDDSKRSVENQIKKIDAFVNNISEDRFNDIIETLSGEYSKRDRELISKIFDSIYINFDRAKGDRVKLVELIIRNLNK